MVFTFIYGDVSFFLFQLPKSIKPDRMKPLRELEETGVISLDLELLDQNFEGKVNGDQPQPQYQPTSGAISQTASTQGTPNSLMDSEMSNVLKDNSVDENQSVGSIDFSGAALVANDDGTFRFSLQALEEEKQGIEIVPISQSEVENLIMQEKSAQKVSIPKSRGFRRHKTYECDLCGKHLSCSTSLSRHKQYHKAEKPYVCEVCNRGFKDNSNLKKHSLIHKREFACHMCKRSFLHKALLAAHLRHHECRSTFIKNGDSSEEVLVRTTIESDGTHVDIVSMKCLEDAGFETHGKKLGNTAISQTNETMTVARNLPSQGIKDEAGADPLKKCGPFPGDIARMYRCGHCGKETIQRGNVMRHLLHHLKKTSSTCKQTFATTNQLQKHVRTQCLGNIEHLNDSVLDKGCATRKLEHVEEDGCTGHKLNSSVEAGCTAGKDDSDQEDGCIIGKLDSDLEDGCTTRKHSLDKQRRQDVRSTDKGFTNTHFLQKHSKPHKVGEAKFKSKLALKMHMKKKHLKNQSKLSERMKDSRGQAEVTAAKGPPRKNRLQKKEMQGQNGLQTRHVQGQAHLDKGNSYSEGKGADTQKMSIEDLEKEVFANLRYSCEMCQRKTKSLKSLSDHLKTHEVKEDLNPAGLKQQEDFHSFTIESPSIKTVEIRSKKNIQESNAPRWYSCGICQNRFDHLKSLSDHLKSHKANEDQNVKKQSQNDPLGDGSVFSTISTTEENSESRMDEKIQCKQFSCALCQDGFESLKSLSNHLKSHETEDREIATEQKEEHSSLSDCRVLMSFANVAESSEKTVYECTSKSLVPVSVLNSTKEISEKSARGTPAQNLKTNSTISDETLTTTAVAMHGSFPSLRDDVGESKVSLPPKIHDKLTDPVVKSSDFKMALLEPHIATSTSSSSEGTLVSNDDKHELVISAEQNEGKQENDSGNTKHHEASTELGNHFPSISTALAHETCKGMQQVSSKASSELCQTSAGTASHVSEITSFLSCNAFKDNQLDGKSKASLDTNPKRYGTAITKVCSMPEISTVSTCDASNDKQPLVNSKAKQPQAPSRVFLDKSIKLHETSLEEVYHVPDITVSASRENGRQASSNVGLEETAELCQTSPKKVGNVPVIATVSTHVASDDQQQQTYSKANLEESQNIGTPSEKKCNTKFTKKRKSVCTVHDNRRFECSKGDSEEKQTICVATSKTSPAKRRKSVCIVSYSIDAEIQKILPLPNEPVLQSLRKKKGKDYKSTPPSENSEQEKLPKLQECKLTLSKEMNEKEASPKAEASVSRRTKYLKRPFKFIS